jgi:hypothetical protein
VNEKEVIEAMRILESWPVQQATTPTEWHILARAVREAKSLPRLLEAAKAALKEGEKDDLRAAIAACESK